MRTDGDRWGIAESVGATALGVAAARALETRRSNALVDDPYAQQFVMAAADQVRLAPGWDVDATWAMLADYVGVRSRFFDLFCTKTSAVGITQTVILAAGLDTRALRLDWPAGSVVFEVDQAGVLEFKDRVLAGHHHPDGSARRVVVPGDLREDWPAALLTAGFDPARPSAWIAEGLLAYLPAQAEVALLDRVHALSTPGTQIAIEHHSTLTKDEMAQRSQLTSRLLGIDLTGLMYLDNREDPGDRLRRYGWDVTSIRATEFAKANRRWLSDDGPSRHAVLINATRR